MPVEYPCSLMNCIGCGRNVRCMLGEGTDFSSQAKAFGYLGLAFGVGSVLGPMIGGGLSMPCQNYGPQFPLCGPGQLNETRQAHTCSEHASFLHLCRCQASPRSEPRK